MRDFGKFAFIFFGVFALFLVLDLLFPLNLDALNKEKSQILYDKNGKIVNMAISKDQIWRFILLIPRSSFAMYPFSSKAAFINFNFATQYSLFLQFSAIFMQIFYQ